MENFFQLPNWYVWVIWHIWKKLYEFVHIWAVRFQVFLCRKPFKFHPPPPFFRDCCNSTHSYDNITPTPTLSYLYFVWVRMAGSQNISGGHGVSMAGTIQLCLEVQTIPDLRWFDLQFFNLTVIQKQYAFGRNLTSNFERASFSRLVLFGRILSGDFEQRQWAAVPSQPGDHEGNQATHLEPRWFQTTLLVFPFSTALSTLHENQCLIIT